MQFNFRQNQHNKQGKVNTIQSSVLLLLLQCTVIALLEVSNIYIYTLCTIIMKTLKIHGILPIYCTWILINCTCTGIMVLNVHGYWSIVHLLV